MPMPPLASVLRRRLLGACAFALLVAACTSAPPSMSQRVVPFGLFPEPKWLTFRCVKFGCDTVQTLSVRVEGQRPVAIKRVVLSDPKRTDFTLEFDRPPPFVAEGSFDVNVRFVPQGTPMPDLDLVITYADASPDESPDRLPPGEFTVPILQRLIGEPALGVEPAVLEFGPVAPGETRTVALTVKNKGVGNTGLRIGAVESDAEQIRAGELPADVLLPGESLEVPVVFSPVAEGFVRAKLRVSTVEEGIAPVDVAASGTSRSGPWIAVSPAALDFGDISLGVPAAQHVTLENQGGAELVIDSIELTDPTGNLAVALAGGAGSVSLAPLESVMLAVALASGEPGELEASIAVSSNDPLRPKVTIPVDGVVTEPRAGIAPTAIDFGPVPKGWSVSRTITLGNSGWGDLKVLGVNFVGGTSELFTMRGVPALPTVLRRDPMVFDVEFRADAEATFTGAISIETNDSGARFIELPLRATGATCQQACPLPNATSSCASGRCEIGACLSGYYNTDRKTDNGCECRDPGPDPGATCSDAPFLGTVVDTEHGKLEFQGRLPVAGDVDVVRFYGKDANGGTYKVQVVLQSTDPSIVFCASYKKTGSPSECHSEPESCPTNRSYEHSSGSWSDDSGVYIVRVYRKPGAAPTCTPYTLKISND